MFNHCAYKRSNKQMFVQNSIRQSQNLSLTNPVRVRKKISGGPQMRKKIGKKY